jgi:hypothetical protein
MQTVYNYIVSLDIYTIMCGLFIVVYGIPFAVHNWIVWFVGIFRKGAIRQSEIGKVLDAAWLICVFWVVIVLSK